MPANNDKNLRYDIGQQEIHDLIKGQTWVKMSIAENKSEENDIKTPVLDREGLWHGSRCTMTTCAILFRHPKARLAMTYM